MHGVVLLVSARGLVLAAEVGAEIVACTRHTKVEAHNSSGGNYGGNLTRLTTPKPAFMQVSRDLSVDSTSTSIQKSVALETPFFPHRDMSYSPRIFRILAIPNTPFYLISNRATFYKFDMKSKATQFGFSDGSWFS